MTKLFCFFLLFCGTLFGKEKYYLSIAAIFRNDARFLKEWIEYHRIVGVEHFYLFNHLSDDEYLSVLEPYIEEGVVELFDWPYTIIDYDHWVEVQCGTYNKILDERKDETFWLAVIDTDEFITLAKPGSLKEFLKNYESYAYLGIQWMLYGTSGVWSIPEGKTMVGTLTKRARKNYVLHRWFKSIVRPNRVHPFINPHFAPPKEPYIGVLENNQKLKGNPAPYQRAEKIRLNHYYYRDEDFFYNEKCMRFIRKGLPAPEMREGLNDVEDCCISPLVPELEKRLFFSNN